MCHVSFRPPSEHGNDLPLAVFEKIAPILFAAKHINLFATGEPTIAKDILFFLDEARKRSHETAQIWICTNGKSLPNAVLDRLQDPRMGLQFSVDGGTPEVFEAIRRGITFDQLCRSLEVANARRGANRYPAFSFSSTISKRNVHDIANIFALAARYRVEQVLFYEEDPEVPEEEQYQLDESDRPVFEAQLSFIESTGIRHWNGLTFRGPASRLPAAEGGPAPAHRCVAWRPGRSSTSGRRRRADLLHAAVEHGRPRHAEFRGRVERRRVRPAAKGLCGAGGLPRCLPDVHRSPADLGRRMTQLSARAAGPRGGRR